ncbi:MAG: 4-diphosphocytidyl-2C-methyl-D-erythritol synthase [Phycisphaerae bacterium]
MIRAVVLAAGQSRRMGTQKLLLPFAGQTVIAHVVDQVVAAGVSDVCVVVGPDHAAIAAALADRPARLVVNPDPQGDMLSSVRAGLMAPPAGYQAAMVVLGDQPSVTADLIAGMLRAFPTCGRGIVVPACAGRRGHPLLFAARFIEEVLTRFDQVGLRGLLAAHPGDVFELPVADAGVLADMDTPADYVRELGRGP